MPTYRSHSTYAPGVNGNTAVIPKPTGTVAGDLLIAHVTADHESPPGTSGDITAPDGTWTELWDVNGGTEAQSLNSAVFWKLAGASEGSDYTFSWTTSDQRTAAMLCYQTGTFDAAAPIHKSSGAATASGGSNNYTTPTIVPTIDGCEILTFFAVDATASFANWTIASQTVRYSFDDGAAVEFVTIGSGYETQATAASISRTGTNTSAANRNTVAGIIAVAPPPVVERDFSWHFA